MPLPSKLPDDFNVKAAENTSKIIIWANRYVILKKIGAGNFGTAFLIEDKEEKNIDRKKKVLKQICVGPVDPGETVDAMHEARLLARMKHKNIVQLHESFLDGQFFCIVLEYCEGGDLECKINEHKVKNEHINEQQVIKWLKQMLNAINHMHQSRVLHRDLKSRNIFLKNNQIKIGDFGISRILLGESDKASTFVGTPYYMSPEVLKHERYDEKCDIWSLGCVLYEICCFTHAFSGSSLMAVMFKIVSDYNPSLPQLYSRAINTILERCLYRDPRNRPTAAEVLAHPIFGEEKSPFKNSKEHLTARQRLKVRKQLEADRKLKMLKEMTRQNFEQKERIRRESKERNFSRSAFNHSMELHGQELNSSSHMIPHEANEGNHEENPEDELEGTVVFQTIKSQNTAPDPLPEDVGNADPSDSRLSSTDELATLIRDGFIPEDDEFADTFYSADDDFEHHSSSSSLSEELPEDILSDTEYRDIMGYMEDALCLDESTSRTKHPHANSEKNTLQDIGGPLRHVRHHDDDPIVPQHNANNPGHCGSVTTNPQSINRQLPARPMTHAGHNVALSTFNNSVVDKKIANVRQRCLDALSDDVFAEAYEIAKMIQFDEFSENSSIRRKLSKIIPDSNQRMDLEQLIYLEQERNSGP